MLDCERLIPAFAILQELERGQDVRQRLRGIPSDHLSSAASLPPDAEAGEPSATPDFDPPSQSATWALEEAVIPNRAETFSSPLYLVNGHELT
jgi:hypothetical protein